MGSTAINKLTSKQICDILKACDKAKVREFAVGELKVSFFGKGDTGRTFVESKNHVVDLADIVHDEQVGEEISQEDREEMRSAQLMIDDPLGFEQEMVDGYLEQGTANEHN